jgi:ABC-type oligopeptide transport system substrate-binding subunit
VVLTRNPNYHCRRPHRLARIELAVGVPPQRAVAQALSAAADYVMPNDIDGGDAARLARRYGPGRRGEQRYFVDPEAQLDMLALNTHRPLFADARPRRAVGYALDRRTLAAWPAPFRRCPASSPTTTSRRGFRATATSGLSRRAGAGDGVAAGARAPRCDRGPLLHLRRRRAVQ